MLLSNSAEYAVRASVYLATLDRDAYHSIREISDALDISFHFLTKIFQKLTQAGLMESLRGPRGGIRLARPADQIHLVEIVVAVDGERLFRACVLGLPGCGDERPCPLHERWARERERLHTMFAGTTLEEMSSDVEEYDFRLTSLAGGASSPGV